MSENVRKSPRKWQYVAFLRVLESSTNRLNIFYQYPDLSWYLHSSELTLIWTLLTSIRLIEVHRTIIFLTWPHLISPIFNPVDHFWSPGTSQFKKSNYGHGRTNGRSDKCTSWAAVAAKKTMRHKDLPQGWCGKSLTIIIHISLRAIYYWIHLNKRNVSCENILQLTCQEKVSVFLTLTRIFNLF